MSGKIFTPTNQVRFTNVAVVRLKKGGKRFEIACYKNKVISWRNKIETDLDEVLQTPLIFSNVSKGQEAKKDELLKCFGTEDKVKICKEILEKGDLQISDKERKADNEKNFREIATIVTNMCINPETERPYTVTMIEKSMKELHFSVNPKRNNKQQALEVISKLNSVIPIQRAKMIVQITVPAKDSKKLKEQIAEYVEIESEQYSDQLLIVGRLDPGHLRPLDELVTRETQGRGTVEVREHKAITEEDSATLK